MLEYVDKHSEAMAGYEGGRTFGNFERRLPMNDKSGGRLKYREWDVNPLRPGVNRGVERLITGSDGRRVLHRRPLRHFQKNPLTREALC